MKFSYFVKCFIDNVLFIWIRNFSKIFRNSNYCIYNITFILCTINYTFYNLNIKLVARNESKKHGWKVTGLSHYNIFKLWRLVLSHFSVFKVKSKRKKVTILSNLENRNKKWRRDILLQHVERSRVNAFPLFLPICHYVENATRSFTVHATFFKPSNHIATRVWISCSCKSRYKLERYLL